MSAANINISDFKSCGRSFMYKTKCNGPSTDPEVTDFQLNRAIAIHYNFLLAIR